MDSANDTPARNQLNNVITVIGPGPYQLIVLLLGGGVFTAEGSLLLMLSVVAKSLIIRWQLSAVFAGAMVTIIFCGLLIGTMAGGIVCDRYGRRMPILVTYFGMTLFLIIAMVSPDCLLLVAAKFLLGVSLGFGVPAANAIVCESCPASHRSNVFSMTMVLFSLGQMYSASVLWAMSPEIDHDELHWRVMLGLAAMLPALLGIVSFFFLMESPHWLLSQRRYSEARDVVMVMASYKENLPSEYMEDFTGSIRTPEVASPEITKANPEGMDDEESGSCSQRWKQLDSSITAFVEDVQRLKLLFSEKFYVTTLLMSYICFVSNFAYYGMVYGLPDTLKHSAPDSPWSPAAGVFLSAFFEIPGVFVAVLLGTTLGRRMNMVISFGCTAMSLAVVIFLMRTNRLENAGIVAVFGVKLFIASVFIVVYLYLLECYPTKCRATGLAFCMVIGRMGAFVCPFLFDGFVFVAASSKGFFIVMCFLVLFASIVSWFLPFETKDSHLMDDEAPTNTVEVLLPPDSLKSLRMIRTSSKGQFMPASPAGNYNTLGPERI